jgi:hypothetical protein
LRLATDPITVIEADPLAPDVIVKPAVLARVTVP